MKIDKFTGRNSLCLWKIKMNTLLNQQGQRPPLSGKKTEHVTFEMKVIEKGVFNNLVKINR